MPDQLRLHAMIPRSHANGPGLRAVLWVQGCSLGCIGCYNLTTHDPHRGRVVSVTDLMQQLSTFPAIEGITISGGEPLQQAPAVLALLRQVRQDTQLSTLIFTGFTWAEVQRMPCAAELPQLLDVVIAGRYDHTQRIATGLMGSANKTLHLLSSRYTAADFTAIPPGEVRIAADGTMTMTGINPLRLEVTS